MLLKFWRIMQSCHWSFLFNIKWSKSKTWKLLCN